MSLYAELKRRNVFRVAILYIVVAWLLLQIADVSISLLGLPDWSGRLTFMLVALGFVPALVFSWLYELTPDGLKRDHKVDRVESITHQTGRKIDTLIGVFGALVIVAILADRLVPDRARGPVTAPADAAVVAAEPTIAVLPFVNMSSDPEQEYFSDGLTEELLNLLAKIPQLKVASRSSAFQFKGEKIDITEVAKKLKVAHVLEGSVRRSGDQLRVTAQLIQADDGFHLWSETYDRPFDNVFAVQDEIATAVVRALRVELLSETPRSEVADPDAYALTLKGRFFYMQWGKDNFERAVDAYRSALEIDPEYARAWAALGITYYSQIQTGYRPRQDAELAVSAVNRALELDPDQPEIWARLAIIHTLINWDWGAGQEAIARGLALDPDNNVVLGAASQLASVRGASAEALGYLDTILAAEPLDLIALFNRGLALVRMERFSEGRASFEKLLEINPQDWGSNTQVAIIDLLEDRPQAALEQLEKEVDPVQQEFARILTLYELDRDEAIEHHQGFIEANGTWAFFHIAQLYAWAGDHDAAFRWLDRGYEHRDPQLPELQVEILFKNLRDDPRFDVLVRKMGLPTS